MFNWTKYVWTKTDDCDYEFFICLSVHLEIPVTETTTFCSFSFELGLKDCLSKLEQKIFTSYLDELTFDDMELGNIICTAQD